MFDHSRKIVAHIIDPSNAHVHSQAVASTTIFASIMGWIPSLAALVAMVYYMILIWESKTLKGIRDKLRHKG